MEEKNNVLKSHCARCLIYTNHTILHEQANIEEDPIYVSSCDKYQIIQCMGCERISFRNEYWDETMVDFDEETGVVDETSEVNCYPKTVNHVSILNHVNYLPDKVKIIYKEAYTSFANNCLLLAAAGFRAVIEAVCIDQKIQGKNLDIKITELVNKKLLTENEADRLHGIRFLGNDSIHKIDLPPKHHLYSALKIICHLLETIYLLKVVDNLDRRFRNYEEFEEILNRCISQIKIPEGRACSLRLIIRASGKNYRIEENLEAKLKERITKGEYTNLTLGKVRGRTIKGVPVGDGTQLYSINKSK